MTTIGELLDPGSRRFQLIDPALVRAMGGDFAAAHVLQHIRFRTSSDVRHVARIHDLHQDDDGIVWLKATWADFEEATGGTPTAMRKAIEALTDAGAIERRRAGRGYAYRVVDDWNVACCARRQNVTKPRVGRDVEGSRSRAQHAAIGDVTITVENRLTEKTCKPTVAEAPAEVQDASLGAVADSWLQTAWDARAAAQRPAPVLAGGKGNAYIALRRIVERFIEAGYEPRDVALAIFHNDGAWTMAALQEVMRRRKADVGTGRENPAEAAARRRSRPKPDWLNELDRISTKGIG